MAHPNLPVEPHDPDDLAAKIRLVLDNPILAGVAADTRCLVAQRALDDLLALLAQSERRLANAEAQLAAVDAAMPFEPPPDSETGVVGRVQAIKNLQADRERLKHALSALREIGGLGAYTKYQRSELKTIARSALARDDERASQG